ncbi:puromycin-sensitive aminopeptidase-like protein [Leptotrombidium deliense]|uniref:Puromycin-sensitive aminopeptidase-like protein n=1 Tax=Leptotrombidium deliense TaxID=299467 RepID=A0A443R3H0_9ACAR|nr:puromycin-sensitive aminopeptidase-like protein [Leptotrombidium deliense]
MTLKLRPLFFQQTLNLEMEILRGFYRSKYTAANGEVRYAATTKFEPHHARRAFSCWDEPAVKAKFDVTLISPKDRVALSNMNVISEENDVDPSKKVYAKIPALIIIFNVKLVEVFLNFLNERCVPFKKRKS